MDITGISTLNIVDYGVGLGGGMVVWLGTSRIVTDSIVVGGIATVGNI